MAYRKTGTWDPSWHTGNLGPGTRDPSGTLEKSENWDPGS